MRSISPFRKRQPQQAACVMKVADASRFLRLDRRAVRKFLEDGDIRRDSVYEWFERIRFPHIAGQRAS